MIYDNSGEEGKIKMSLETREQTILNRVKSFKVILDQPFEDESWLGNLFTPERRELHRQNNTAKKKLMSDVIKWYEKIPVVVGTDDLLLIFPEPDLDSCDFLPFSSTRFSTDNDNFERIEYIIKHNRENNERVSYVWEEFADKWRIIPPPESSKFSIYFDVEGKRMHRTCTETGEKEYFYLQK
ncbi:hypothetical protein EBB07_28450 [Paenibacillaceae bacterium]|nr:hypothetical protein EBB07_28450 [Paenibacillaceae bacterium]